VLRQKDPELRSFFNVNSPEDLARAERFVKSEIKREAEWISPA